MIENFDEILKAKLSDAVSAPPDGLWSKIEQNIVPSSVPTDEAVRSKLANSEITPPVHLWKKIAASLKPNVPIYKLPIFRRIAAAVLILSSLSYIYFANPFTETIEPNIAKSEPNTPAYQLDNEPSISDTKSPDFQPNTSDISIVSQTPNTTTAIEKPQHSQSQNIVSQVVESQNDFSIIEPIENTEEIPYLAANRNAISTVIYQPIPIANTEINKVQAEEEPTVETISTNETKNAEGIAELPVEIALKDTAKIEDPIIASNQSTEIQNNEDVIKPNSLPLNPRDIDKKGLSLHYSPSRLNTGLKDLNQHEIDLTFTYQNVNIIAELGLGFGMNEEKTPYSIDYSRYEFVKMQFVTDSLSFTYDPVNQTYTPVAFGHQEMVYDDVDHSFSSIALTQNYWMNIPLNVGYIKNFKRFALKAGVGIKYSVLLSSKVRGLYELDNQSIMRNMYFPSQNRTKTNICYNLNAGIIFRLNERLHFNTEAVALFYQSPVYAESTQRAYGYGLRTGFTYYFL